MNHTIGKRNLFLVCLTGLFILLATMVSNAPLPAGSGVNLTPDAETIVPVRPALGQTGCSVWPDVISKYNAYVDGQAQWSEVISCYNQYVNPSSNHPPVANAGPDQTAIVGTIVHLNGGGSGDADGDPLTYHWSFVSIPAGSSAVLSSTTAVNPTFTADRAGAYVAQLIVNDGKADSIPDTVTVTASQVSISVPYVVNMSQSAAMSAIITAQLTVGTITWAHSNIIPLGYVISQLPAGGSSVPQGSSVNLTISLGPEGNIIPPDPSVVAPPIDRTVATTVYTSTEFLYTGDNPIQTGVAPGTIELRRAAVLRGKVMSRDGNPLSGVTITILNHQEYGQTLSRADGMFDMVVNGGGLFTIRYEKEGYLPAQRQKDIPWQDYMWFPEVRMMPADSLVTIIDLGSPADFQVARGSEQTDERGTRRSTLLFPKGTQAWLVMPDKSEQPITSLTVRATEYTVGTEGPQLMPAELPPNSAYTYCEEFSIDEADASGATGVRFSQPLISYNENFLNFPVGTNIPMGYYDRDRGVWVPYDNGKVVKILSINAGLAELDTDGDGAADNGVSLGITTAERVTLAGLYSAGQSVWRVPVPHLSPWDKNMGIKCDDRKDPCLVPENPSPFEKPPACPDGTPAIDERTGSFIGCQSQTLGERVEITGTPFHLRYQSDRVPGRKEAYTLEIPLTGSSISLALKKVLIDIQVAGRQFSEQFDPATDLSYTFTWDGKDAYGRTLQGRQPITVKIGYGYGMIRGETDRFGYNGNGKIIIDDTQMLFIIWQVQNGFIGLWDARAVGLGAWNLNVHHAYEPVSHTLNLGDGRQRGVSARSMDVIKSVARFYATPGIAVGPDGSVYVGAWTDHRVYRIGPDGVLTTLAGTGEGGYSGDGGPATQAKISHPTDVAVGPDSSVYFIQGFDSSVIRRIGPDGIITTVAGTGIQGYSGDGGPATQAQIWPSSIAIGPDGSIYIGDLSNRVRRVAPDGIITTVAGNGQGLRRDVVDGVPATTTHIGWSFPEGVAVGQDGSLYLTDRAYYVRKVTPDGIIHTVAGNGSQGFSGDGGPATSAVLASPHDLAIDKDGSLYLIDYSNWRVRRISPNGIIITVAGGGYFPGTDFGDGGPATACDVELIEDIAIAPDGSLYIATYNGGMILRVAPILPGYSIGNSLIPSEDGSEIYLFDWSGRHLQTLNPLTNAVVYEFSYDSAGRLTQVKDGDGNVTTIGRNTSGSPTAIVSPYGQRTTVNLDSNNYLSRIANPAAELTQFSYTSDGLLATMTDARGNVYSFTYDSDGRLVKDDDPAGGRQTLSRSGTISDYAVTLTTGENRSTAYEAENLSTGDQTLTNTFPDGTQTDTVIKTDGSSTSTVPDGTVMTQVLGPDPRFSMQAPLPKSKTVTTPGSLASNLTMERSVTLTDPSNPLSLSAMTDTIKINNRAYTSAYTAGTRVFTDTTPAGRQSTAKIDSMGRVIEHQISGLSSTTFTYDGQGRLTAVTQGSGQDARNLSFQYNTEGYVDSLIDPLSSMFGFEYDPAGRITKDVLPDGREVTYAYDANDNITSITPPGRPAHSFSYSPVNLMTEYTPPDVLPGIDKTQYTYNKDRQLTKILRPDNQVIDYGYDSAGRLSTITYSGGQVSSAYDPETGNITQITASDGGTLTYTYDGFLLTGKTWAGSVSGSVGYGYDSDFRVKTITVTVDSVDTVSYQYDNDGLVTKAGEMTLTRNTQNGLLTGTSLGSVTDAQTYNGFGELSTCSASYGGTAFYSVQYTYDKLGRITQKTETVTGTTDTYNYFYDSSGRLTTVKKNNTTIASYTYDSNNNRVSYTATGGTVNGFYDNQDRLTQYGSTTYTYTANGELLMKTAGGQTTTYSYDVFGNLTGVTLPDGKQINYIVDGNNRRIGKKVNGTLVQGFLYQDVLQPIAELDGSNNVVSQFIYATGVNVPDYMIKGGITYRIITDHLGSPRLVVKTADGTIAQRMDYDEFGNVITDTNPGFQPFGFAGGLYDPDTRLVRFGARDYDSETGRWTAKDPILFTGGDINLYGYVLNDPVKRSDSSGLGKWLERWIKKIISPLDINNPKAYPLGPQHPKSKIDQIFMSILAPIWVGPAVTMCGSFHETELFTTISIPSLIEPGWKILFSLSKEEQRYILPFPASLLTLYPD